MFHVLYCFSLHFIPSQQSLNRFRIQPQTDIIALHDIPARCIMPYSMVTKTTTTKKTAFEQPRLLVSHWISQSIICIRTCFDSYLLPPNLHIQ